MGSDNTWDGSRAASVLARRRAWRLAWAAAGLLVALVAGAAVYWYTLLNSLAGFHTPDVEPPPEGPLTAVRPGERVNFLFLGVDACLDADGKVLPEQDIRRCRSRADTIIVASFDPETRELGLLSIPRDTRVLLPGRGYDKAGHAYAYGGVALAVATVEELLDIDVQYWVRSNFEGFARVVDALGGVDLCVEKDMDYDDPLQNLAIHLKAGCQELNGQQALGYVRYRSDERGDIGRIERQQQFIRAVAARATRFGIVFQLHGLLADLKPYVDTNLTPKDILDLAKLGLKVDLDRDFATGTIPGSPVWLAEPGGRVSYWQPDVQATRALVERLLLGIDRDANAAVRVEVLNGTTRQGLAGQLAASLQAYGFDVVRVANAERTDVAVTEVINRDGPEKFRRVTRVVLRVLDGAQFLERRDAQASADVTIIVGADYAAAVGRQ